MYYVHKDHLGSPYCLTDKFGQIPVLNGKEQCFSFDPWGRRRNATDWSCNSVPTKNERLFDRGFTGHEHLDLFGLINMNGRTYDPWLGRMLQPDNYVQDGNNSQSYNRYSYCINNPLKYTDPSGEIWHLVVGAAIGGISNWMMNGAEFSWKGLGHFGVGAAAGAIGTGVGAGVNATIAGGSFGTGFIGSSTVSSTGFFAGAATGASGAFTTSFVNGFGNAGLEGHNVSSMLQFGLNEGKFGAISGGVIGGIYGGINAVENGRKFWSGNAKLYKGTSALYASLDGGASVYTDVDDCTVFNASGYDAFYKPEDGVYGVKNKIPNGYGIKIGVDGVATSKSTSEVFKIPGKSGYYPSAYINSDGDVDLDFSAKAWIALKYQEIKNPGYKYGWMKLSELDKGWEELFKLAGTIKQ